jgi:glyoxylase-like metal-dependent hydrolase (beta-lactamase superfamily II)
MKHQIPVDPDAQVGVGTKRGSSRVREIAPDLACKRLALVNVVFYGKPGAGDREWVLIDTGVGGTAGLIIRAAAQRFGNGSRPYAIILTHGHFDHVGSLLTLAERWDAPVYAHPLEHPFLNGSSSYPAPDPSVGGGLMAALSPLYPRGPIDISRRLNSFSAGMVPGMPNWVWFETPGHSPGHVSLWRQCDRTLIAGDAFITTNQESAYSVATQRPELHGPPQYYTPDWACAAESVRCLARLEPELVVTGHGPSMFGPKMRTALHTLANNFERVAVPEHGRYVRAAA